MALVLREPPAQRSRVRLRWLFALLVAVVVLAASQLRVDRSWGMLRLADYSDGGGGGAGGGGAASAVTAPLPPLPDDAFESEADVLQTRRPDVLAASAPITQCANATMRTLPQRLTAAYASTAAGLPRGPPQPPPPPPAPGQLPGVPASEGALCARLLATRHLDPLSGGPLPPMPGRCKRADAGYLLMHTGTEGLSKWSHSVLESLQLAKRLNRTWVEPCVRDGRIIACAPGLVVPVPSGSRGDPASHLLAGTDLEDCDGIAGEADPLRVAAFQESCGRAEGVEPARMRAYPLRLYFDMAALRDTVYDRIISFDEWSRRELCECAGIVNKLEVREVPVDAVLAAASGTPTPLATPTTTPNATVAAALVAGPTTLAAEMPEALCVHHNDAFCWRQGDDEIVGPLTFRHQHSITSVRTDHGALFEAYKAQSAATRLREAAMRQMAVDGLVAAAAAEEGAAGGEDGAAASEAAAAAIAAAAPVPGTDDESCYETNGAQEWMLPWLAARATRTLVLVQFWRHSFHFPGRCDAMPPFNPLHQRAVDAWLRRRFGRGVGHRFAAFQWRTETISSAVLPGCAQNLLAKMQEVRWAMALAAAVAAPAPQTTAPSPAPAVLIADLPSETNPCKMWTVYAGSKKDDNRKLTLSMMMPPGVEKYDGWLPGVDAGVLSIRDLILGRSAQVYVTAVRLRSTLTSDKEDAATCGGCFYCASGFAGAVVRSRSDEDGSGDEGITVTRWPFLNASDVLAQVVAKLAAAASTAPAPLVAPAAAPAAQQQQLALIASSEEKDEQDGNVSTVDSDGESESEDAAAKASAAAAAIKRLPTKAFKLPPFASLVEKRLRALAGRKLASINPPVRKGQGLFYSLAARTTAAYDSFTPSARIAAAAAGNATANGTAPQMTGGGHLGAMCARLMSGRSSDPLAGNASAVPCGAARYLWLHSTHESEDDVTRWGGSVLEALHLAKRLRRTFVEPCVRGGRIVPCAPGLVLPVPLTDAGARMLLGGRASALAAISGRFTNVSDPLRVAACEEDCGLAPGLAQPADGRAYPLRLYFNILALKSVVYDNIISFNEWSRRELCECATLPQEDGGSGLAVSAVVTPGGRPTLAVRLPEAVDMAFSRTAGVPELYAGGGGSGDEDSNGAGDGSHPIIFARRSSLLDAELADRGLLSLTETAPAMPAVASATTFTAASAAVGSAAPSPAAATPPPALQERQRQLAALRAAFVAGAAAAPRRGVGSSRRLAESEPARAWYQPLAVMEAASRWVQWSSAGGAATADGAGAGGASAASTTVNSSAAAASGAPCFTSGGALQWADALLGTSARYAGSRTLTLARYRRYTFGSNAPGCAGSLPPLHPGHLRAVDAWLTGTVLPSARGGVGGSNATAPRRDFVAAYLPLTRGAGGVGLRACASRLSDDLAPLRVALAGAEAPALQLRRTADGQLLLPPVVLLTVGIRTDHDPCALGRGPRPWDRKAVVSGLLASVAAASGAVAPAGGPPVAVPPAFHLPDWLPGVDAGVRQLRQLAVASAARLLVTMVPRSPSAASGAAGGGGRSLLAAAADGGHTNASTAAAADAAIDAPPAPAPVLPAALRCDAFFSRRVGESWVAAVVSSRPTILRGLPLLAAASGGSGGGDDAAAAAGAPPRPALVRRAVTVTDWLGANVTSVGERLRPRLPTVRKASGPKKKVKPSPRVKRPSPSRPPTPTGTAPPPPPPA